MLLTAFPDLLNFQKRTRIASDIKARLEQTSIEAVTGKREDVTKAVNGNIGGVHLLQKALDDIEQDKRINSLTGSRLALTNTALSSIRTVIDGLGTSGIIAVSNQDAFTLATIADQAESDLRNTISLLNTSHGSRKLFSGDATDKSPLASPDALLADVRAIIQANPDPTDVQTALDTYFNDPAGGFATNIYQGGANDAPASFLADGSKIKFPIRADNQTLRDTMRGLAIMAVTKDSGHSIDSTQFKDIFTQGTDAISRSTEAIIQLESRIGVSEGLIEKADEQQRAESLSLGTAINGLIGRDQFDAATELKQLEAQLEASYLVTSRLSNLRLTNFLR